MEKEKEHIVPSNIFLRYSITLIEKSTRRRCERVKKAAFIEKLSSGFHTYWKQASQVSSNKTSENKLRISDRNSSGLKVKIKQARPENLCIAELHQKKGFWPSICQGGSTGGAAGMLRDSSPTRRDHTAPSQGKAFLIDQETSKLADCCSQLLMPLFPAAWAAALQHWRWNHHLFCELQQSPGSDSSKWEVTTSSSSAEKGFPWKGAL